LLADQSQANPGPILKLQAGADDSSPAGAVSGGIRGIEGRAGVEGGWRFTSLFPRLRRATPTPQLLFDAVVGGKFGQGFLAHIATLVEAHPLGQPQLEGIGVVRELAGGRRDGLLNPPAFVVGV